MGVYTFFLNVIDLQALSLFGLRILSNAFFSNLAAAGSKTQRMSRFGGSRATALRRAWDPQSPARLRSIQAWPGAFIWLFWWFLQSCYRVLMGFVDFDRVL